jgi:hypothetical protein
MDREHTIPQSVRNSEAGTVFCGTSLEDIKAVHPVSLVVTEFEDKKVSFAGIFQPCGESQILFGDPLTGLKTREQREKENAGSHHLFYLRFSGVLSAGLWGGVFRGWRGREHSGAHYRAKLIES